MIFDLRKLIVPIDELLEVILLRIFNNHRRVVGLCDAQWAREERHHFAVVAEPPQQLSPVLAHHLVACGYCVQPAEAHSDFSLRVAIECEACVRLVWENLAVCESHLLLVVECAYQ